MCLYHECSRVARTVKAVLVIVTMLLISTLRDWIKESRGTSSPDGYAHSAHDAHDVHDVHGAHCRREQLLEVYNWAARQIWKIKEHWELYLNQALLTSASSRQPLSRSSWTRSTRCWRCGRSRRRLGLVGNCSQGWDIAAAGRYLARNKDHGMLDVNKQENLASTEDAFPLSLLHHVPPAPQVLAPSWASSWQSP